MFQVPQAAADPLQDNSALKFASSDVSFYVSGMRMREIFDKVVASKAIAKLKSIPAVQLGWAWAAGQWANPGAPQLATLKGMLADPANQPLIELVQDALSHEIFVYGDQSCVEALKLVMEINAAVTQGQLDAMEAGDLENLQTYSLRNVVTLLDQRGDRLKVPTLLKGMRLSNTQRAADQLKRLETLVQGELKQHPDLQAQFSREQIGGSEFLTLQLDGTLIPWPAEVGEKVDPQLVQQLTQKINALKMVISLGLHDNYLLISIGADNKHLATLGQGSLLYDRDEMAAVHRRPTSPLRKWCSPAPRFRKKWPRSVNRWIRAWRWSSSSRLLLASTPELQEELVADVEKLAQYIKDRIPEPGALTSYNYLTPEGYESFTYNWGGESVLDASQELSVLKHVGGDPLAFWAARGKSDPRDLDALTAFVSRLVYYGEQIGLQQFGEAQRANYERMKTEFLPLAERLSAATRDKLVPAFADGQSTLVLDAKSKSAAWHEMLPPADGELPMLELGIVLGVSDAQLVKEGFGECFQIAQEALDKLHELSAGDMREMFPSPVPPIKLAQPASRTISDGTVYYYALPGESGVDKQLAPNAGLSDSVMVVSLLPRFTARLLAAAPLQAGGPLANTNRPLAAAFHFDFSGLLGVVAPWVDYGAALLLPGGMNAESGGPLGNIPQQIQDVIEVLQCFRGVSGVTYQDGEVAGDALAVAFCGSPVAARFPCGVRPEARARLRGSTWTYDGSTAQGEPQRTAAPCLVSITPILPPQTCQPQTCHAPLHRSSAFEQQHDDEQHAIQQSSPTAVVEARPHYGIVPKSTPGTWPWG